MAEVHDSHFRAVVHAAFAHRRKKLITNLRTMPGNANCHEIMKDSGLDEKIRAENLSVEQFCKLAKQYSSFL